MDYSVMNWVNNEKGRYYQVIVQRDLLGDLIVLQRWGSLNSRQGGCKRHYCKDKEHAFNYLQKLNKRRSKRGYEALVF